MTRPRRGAIDPASLPGEFALIARHFVPLAARVPGALGLTDDAALLDVPPGRSLVAAADAMVAGVHFLPDDPPALVGRKLLRVNLSDLAAMGAEPLAYLLTITLPKGTPEDWIAGLCAGLAEDQKTFGISLVGGDTTSAPAGAPAVLSLTILGLQDRGCALLRIGAEPHDDLWVSGSIGDGALGLLARTGGLPATLAPTQREALASRYLLPEPRLALGRALVGIAHAAMDVSDGLVGDLGHLCRAAGLGAEIEVAAVPLSEPAQAALAGDPKLMQAVLTGGDDYELLFAAPPAAEPRLRGLADQLGLRLSRIGRMLEAPVDPARPVEVRDASGALIALERAGWSHF